MAKVHIDLNEQQRQLLMKHWYFYRALDDGSREPTTPAQWRFVAVCHGKCESQTEHEVAYLLGRRLIENSKLSTNEVVRRGFHVPPLDMKDSEIVPAKSATGRVEYHAVDVDRFSSKRRWVPRHNW